jgi:hypothetical protein
MGAPPVVIPVVGTSIELVPGVYGISSGQAAVRGFGCDAAGSWTACLPFGDPAEEDHSASLEYLRSRVELGLVAIEWALEGEAAVSGFHVYRRMAGATAEDRLTDELLPAKEGAHTFDDPTVTTAGNYVYRLSAVLDAGTEITMSETEVRVVRVLTGPVLLPPGPNPGKVGTRLVFVLPRATHVDVDILDAAGRNVRGLFSGTFAPGRHALIWDGRDDRGSTCASGRYYVRLHAGREDTVHPLTLVR